MAFICNQNQARSQFLEAVFSQMLPTLNFESFGIIAQESTPIPKVIEAVFRDFDLATTGRFARNMGLHWGEVQNFDLIFAMTTFIYEEIKILGFQGILVDLEEWAKNLGISVVDPQLMPRRQCAFELAKYLKVGFTALQSLGFFDKSLYIKALIPERESLISKTVELALAESSAGTTIIYGDLVAPRNDLLSSRELLTQKFLPNAHGSEYEVAEDEVKSRILVPAHSSMWPARTYLGAPWREFLQSIQGANLILITPPMRNSSGMVAESFLSALSANQVQIVT